VWTPKRILLLAAGFALFFAAYLVYTHFLGGVDGLKPLPAEYGPILIEDSPTEPPPPRESSAEEKLRLAFGDNCEELKRKMNLELGSRGMVLSIDDFKTQEDGRVKLMPFSLAIFRKSTDGKTPEINTVKSQQALLTFDRPVSNPTDLVNRKIIAGELSGDIYLINNRRTPQRDDDVSLFTRGPLFYQESTNRIWTPADVKVVDLQSKPKPTTIVGTGMDIQLTADSKPASSAPGTPPKHKSDGPSGADWIKLRRDVEMDLWADSRFGLSGTSKSAPGKPAAAAGRPGATPPPQPNQADRSKVVIKTQGPFVYDLRTDRATFDMLHNQPDDNFVTVDRINELEGKLDYLACERLEIQFRRKSAPAPPSAADTGSSDGLDIETARATGKEVILTSDAEVLEAHGTDFSYDRRTQLSILKGSPRMWALKEGNEIHAHELQMINVKGGQQATALGEGFLRALDKKTGKRTMQARWKKKLIYGKDGTYDLLTLYGDASFDDEEHGQHLEADLLKAWLEPSEQPAPGGGDPQRRKVHHLEATGHVAAQSAEANIYDTERLIVYFKDLPPVGSRLPAVAPAPAAAMPSDPRPGAAAGESKEARSPQPANGALPESRQPQEANGAQPASLSAQANGAPPQGEPAAKPKKPMDLSARQIRTYVLRSDTKNELDKIWCEGSVRVHQEPSAPGDKGVDIEGGTLELTHHVDGNVLAVTRDEAAGKEAHVQIDKLFILGPTVNIDQTTNECWVNGPGVMRMPSKSNFDGTALAREIELTVSWTTSMVFDGQRAYFQGAVQATQDNGRVTCDSLEVNLDRKVSLREGNRGNAPSPKVQKLVCARNVWIEDSTYQVDASLLSNKRIRCPELTVDNDTQADDSQVNAVGPGTVRLFQLGAKGELLPQGPAGQRPPPANPMAQQPRGKPEEEYKLTQVSYVGMMVANNKRGTATFYQQVVVVHVPTDNPDLPIDEDHPPKDSIRLSCYDKLQVFSRRLPDGTTSKEMTAYNRVTIVGPDFSGTADVVKYDESKDQVILEGTDANPALLDKQEIKGGQRKLVRGRKIIYSPRTGEFHGDGITNISLAK
jgi:lipopolysaccharide export system protein LptA